MNKLWSTDTGNMTPTLRRRHWDVDTGNNLKIMNKLKVITSVGVSFGCWHIYTFFPRCYGQCFWTLLKWYYFYLPNMVLYLLKFEKANEHYGLFQLSALPCSLFAEWCHIFASLLDFAPAAIGCNVYYIRHMIQCHVCIVDFWLVDVILLPLLITLLACACVCDG